MKPLKNTVLAAVLLVSSGAMLGWWIDHAALAAILPGIANMTFNTALCFFLIALSCAIPDTKLRTADQIRCSIGGLIVLFAGLSLLQDAFDLHLGIDNMLFNTLDSTTPHPGRMSPNTAAGFVLSGLILISLNWRKPRLQLTTVTHTLILLLAIVSLLGIGMNVLITDVPPHFAHFASISLFTAISFLLLAIVFLDTFHQQVRSHFILHSGIQLMYRLKYPGKFALISLVMLIPLSILMWNELNLLEDTVKQAKVKIIGIAHIEKTSQLIKAIPEHRGMLNAHLADPNIFGSTLKEKEREIDQLFANNHTMDIKHAALIKIPDTWPLITARWASIKNNHMNPVLSWRMHTEIIALLGKHLRNVGSVTLLSYDPDPMIHNLVAAQLEILPQLFEHMGQLRGQGTAFIAHRHISREQQLTMGAMASQISLLLQESEQLTAMALQQHPSSKLSTQSLAYARLTRAFLSTVEQQLLTPGGLSIAPEAFFREASRALSAGYTFSHTGLKQIKQLLEQRITDNISSQYTIKLSAMLVILLILYLFAAFYRSVMNTIDALGDAAKQMKCGQVDQLAKLPVHDELGDIVGSFNTIAEELMRVSSHMSAVVDHAVDGIITINRHGEIKSFNPAAEQIFGYTWQDMIGQDVTILMPEQYHARHRAGLLHYNQSGNGSILGKSIEVHGIRKNGEQFPMALSINAMNLDDQQMFIGMIRDITDNQHMETQLRHAQKMEAVGALVGGVAHNFNNLLAGIIGKTYLAKRKAQHQPDILSYLESIESISSQAGDMIRQLLTFARKDFFSEQQDTALDELITEAFTTARLAIPEDIKLELQVMDADMIVHCDTVQIQQVLMNMMNNARDAVQGCKTKQITIRLEKYTPDHAFTDRHPTLSSVAYACLSIMDNGHGMDADTIDKIFDPFYTTKEVGKGTGLGLSTAFGTLASHQGGIEVDSQPGHGTEFRIYLPIVETIASTAPQQPDDKPHHNLTHETLLLVDDEPMLLYSIKEVLEELGYQVVKARNGKQGLERYRKERKQIVAIITDVIMPEMGGVEMFRHIRAIDPHIPTIFMTGYDQGQVQLSSEEQSNTLILSKPLQIATLSRHIETLLKQIKQ